MAGRCCAMRLDAPFIFAAAPPFNTIALCFLHTECGAGGVVPRDAERCSVTFHMLGRTTAFHTHRPLPLHTECGIGGGVLRDAERCFMIFRSQKGCIAHEQSCPFAPPHRCGAVAEACRETLTSAPKHFINLKAALPHLSTLCPRPPTHRTWRWRRRTARR